MISFRFEGLAKDLKPSLVKIVEQEEEKKGEQKNAHLVFKVNRSRKQGKQCWQITSRRSLAAKLWQQ